jgi:hypothetical protein
MAQRPEPPVTVCAVELLLVGAAVGAGEVDCEDDAADDDVVVVLDDAALVVAVAAVPGALAAASRPMAATAPTPPAATVAVSRRVRRSAGVVGRRGVMVGLRCGG